ncbi:MAG TPA: acyl-CoA dehydrogenase family protein [Candidatus Binataceae bacterium]|nr:acyl-CoA dehydrogenase family protein [Candidatus Binataceae bacterium]
MDFNFTAEQEAFRHMLRGWLERTADELFPAMRDRFGGSLESLLFAGDDAQWARMLEYHRRLHRAGYLALHWPTKWGGGGGGPVEQSIYQDEVLRLGLPLYGANQFAIDRIGPTLMLLGTEQQKKRFLPAMLTGDEIWCQGYSEPAAGSDLASLRTRAVRDGDWFIINGEKLWTSLAHRADWQVMLVRTDPDAPPHKGISYLLVAMNSPGVTVRPLVKITGESGFNEVFFDNVRVPAENLVGEINRGWQVSIATMMFQRTSAGTRHPIERTINELIGLVRTITFDGRPADRHPWVRQRLASFAIESQCLRLSRYRALTGQIRGQPPGPASSFGKLFASELNLRVAMFAIELLGPYATLEAGSRDAIEGGRWAYRMIAAREHTIAGGTSEIQRNIIGERVLGLPRG